MKRDYTGTLTKYLKTMNEEFYSDKIYHAEKEIAKSKRKKRGRKKK